MVRFLELSSLLLSAALASAHPGRRAVTTSDCVGVNAIAPGCASRETLSQRDTFYVGGNYVNSAAGNLTYDQLYVEKLTPSSVTQTKPIVFFHGGGVSGVVGSYAKRVHDLLKLTVGAQRRGLTHPIIELE